MVAAPPSARTCLNDSGGGSIPCVGVGLRRPAGVLTLQRGQLGDSVAPTLGATAVIEGSPYPDCRRAGPSSGAAWRSASVIGRSLIGLRGVVHSEA